MPRGVLPRFLYSVAAIVFALFLVVTPPVGDGHSHAEAYAQQGMFAQLAAYAEEPYRWRSLGRWSAHAAQWWSGWTGQIDALLVLFTERARSPCRADALLIALTSHVHWEAVR